MARPERFELPTTWFVARYSIQLSYGRVKVADYIEVAEEMAEREGFEPSMEFPPYTLSRGAPSTTRPSLRIFRGTGQPRAEMIFAFAAARLYLLQDVKTKDGRDTQPVRPSAGVRPAVVRTRVSRTVCQPMFWLPLPSAIWPSFSRLMRS